MYMSEQMRLRGEGKYNSKPIYDVLRPRVQEQTSPDEVIDRLVAGGGLVIVDEPPGPSSQD